MDDADDGEDPDTMEVTSDTRGEQHKDLDAAAASSAIMPFGLESATPGSAPPLPRMTPLRPPPAMASFANNDEGDDATQQSPLLGALGTLGEPAPFPPHLLDEEEGEDAPEAAGVPVPWSMHVLAHRAQFESLQFVSPVSRPGSALPGWPLQNRFAFPPATQQQIEERQKQQQQQQQKESSGKPHRFKKFHPLPHKKHGDAPKHAMKFTPLIGEGFAPASARPPPHQIEMQQKAKAPSAAASTTTTTTTTAAAATAAVTVAGSPGKHRKRSRQNAGTSRGTRTNDPKGNGSKKKRTDGGLPTAVPTQQQQQQPRSAPPQSGTASWDIFYG